MIQAVCIVGLLTLGTFMCRTALWALIAVLSLQAATAREIRRDAMPEAPWGTWAPGTDACKEGDTSAIVLSAKTYAGPAGSCVIDCVTEVPGRAGPIYSARMRRSVSSAQAQKKTVANLIIRSEDAGQVSLGPTFDSLAPHGRCTPGEPAKKQQ